MGTISSKGRSNISCSTNATRSAGPSVSSTTSSARPTESASCASCSGSLPSAWLTIGSGTSAPRGCSRRDLRERSMSRHTRATTVVSDPPRFSTPLVSERLRRSQLPGRCRRPRSARRASGRPPPRRWVRLASNRSRQPVVVVHRSHSLVAFRQRTDGRRSADVTRSPAPGPCRLHHVARACRGSLRGTRTGNRSVADVILATEPQGTSDAWRSADFRQWAIRG
jgi:hypothetical protein